MLEMSEAFEGNIQGEKKKKKKKKKGKLLVFSGQSL